MRRFIDFAARLARAGERVYARKWSFFGLFAVVFLVSVIVLGTSGLLPEVSSENKSKTTSIVAQPQIATELPIKIEIPKINLSAVVVNPTITTVAVLDKELLKGAVRYPTSAKLGEDGNVVLFGHSSYLPVVGNQAYKTFNEIQKLAVGDSITV
ncbi:MAG: sortase, partial [Patescibacteria group bacterium]